MMKVGEMSELTADKPLRASLGSEKILIFLVEDAPVATAARCPHAHGPLHQGELCGTVLTCPWHGWSFDLITGECEEDPDLRLKRYDVTVDGNDILVASVTA
ncbi:Rieske (2Fe-2S) protein [Sphingobium terrigena]|uniref:Rieske (2Fe-2S) protein n=1 Tax=Sphingobium terrigena TaxID=2304063 RepID=A0A418YR68_9SPHN|nr:Rieske (2Fe-2S) protein [Sphingobium terrigena]RJG54132.1 Rieske (2Fe-2S) protein [Sphingobium terrigena]